MSGKNCKHFRVREYVTADGRSPFRKWLDSLDLRAKALVQARILRVEDGNLGDFRSVGSGVFELKIDFGPGYRIYFGFSDNEMILILNSGDKGNQKKDIIRAIKFWNDYLKEK